MNKLLGAFLFVFVSSFQVTPSEVLAMDGGPNAILNPGSGSIEAEQHRIGDDDCPPGYVMWGIGDNAVCVPSNGRSADDDCPPGYVMWGIGDNAICVDPNGKTGIFE